MNKAVIGSAQLYFSTLTSTNQFANYLLSKTRPSAGTVISTAYQSVGEGQFGRSWFGSKGTNLYLSVILYPQIPAEAQFKLSAFVALALRDTVGHFIDKRVTIKWPNDIYVENRKIGGILIRNSISGLLIQNTVIGIGLNVNEIEFPGDLPNPTSVNIESGHDFDLNTVMKKLLDFLNVWHQKAREMPFNILKKQYTAHLYNMGKISPFHKIETNTKLSARIHGVDDMGRLLLEIPDVGRVEAFALNQIRLITE